MCTSQWYKPHLFNSPALQFKPIFFLWSFLRASCHHSASCVALPQPWCAECLCLLSKDLGWQGLYISSCVCLPMCTLIYVVQSLHSVSLKSSHGWGFLKDLSEQRHLVIFHFGVCVINHLLTGFSFVVPVWNSSPIIYFKNHLQMFFILLWKLNP